MDQAATGEGSPGQQQHDDCSHGLIEPPSTSSSSSLTKQKHERFELLILSEAGKPIYSYTKREDAVTLMPLCSALIDYASKTQKETLRSIKTPDGLVMHFNKRSPLIIIVIHEINSYVDARLLVEQVEAQVISIMTAKTLTSVFEERPTYDLKRSLYGSEKLIDATTNLCAFPKKLVWPWIEAFIAVTSPNTSQPGAGSSGPKLAANPTLPQRPHRVLIPIVIVPPSIRDSVHNIIHNVITSSSKSIVFSLFFRMVHSTSETTDRQSFSSATSGRRENQEGEEDVSPPVGDEENVTGFELMTVCNHHDRHKIKIADIHIILALLCGSRSQLASVESLWMPICLPKFNQDAFLHSYIAYMNNNKHCIVMMSIDRDEFSNCQRSRNLIEEKLEVLLKDSSQQNKLNYRLSPLVHPTLLEIQDRLMNETLSSEEKAQLQQEAKSHNSKLDQFHTRQLQFLWYQTNKQVLWWQRSGQKSVNPVIYYITRKMLQSSLKHLWLKISDDTICLGWHVPSFQLYAQFDSTITTNEATEALQRITNWIKKEEDNFSIKDYT